MREKTRQNLRELAKITGEKCATCITQTQHRCCEAFFCNLAQKEMEALGVSIPTVPNGALPYMGPFGCVVPPEYRPGCSGFVCPPHLKDKTFRTKYLKLLSKVRSDPAIQRAMEVPSTLCKALLEEKSKFLTKALELIK